MKSILKKSYLLAMLFAATLFGASQAQALTLDGTKIAPSIKAGAQEMQLNGAGIRSKWGFNVYVGALYLPQKSSDAASIINGDSPMGIRLYITSGLISGDKMADATLEGFDNSTNGNPKPIQPQIDRLIKVFKDSIEKGDVFDLIYKTETGVNIYKNGKFMTSVAGLEFKRALFGIWLGNKPPQKKMRDGMLGK